MEQKKKYNIHDDDWEKIFKDPFCITKYPELYTVLMSYTEFSISLTYFHRYIDIASVS